MTKVHRQPRSFRLDEPDWDRLKIIALQNGYRSRYAFLSDQIKLIANASNTQNLQSDRNSIKL